MTDNPTPERSTRLYERNTYAPTVYLKNLQMGGKVTKEDIAELFEVYLEGASDAGVYPTIQDFGAWLGAYEGYSGCDPAEVVW